MSSSSYSHSDDDEVDPAPGALDSWFDNHPARSIKDASELFRLVSNPPLGRTEVRVPTKSLSKHIGLKRSGPAGWTYFPAHADGSRLARIHFQYIRWEEPTAHRINAIVRLFDSSITDCEEHVLHEFKCSSEALLDRKSVV